MSSSYYIETIAPAGESIVIVLDAVTEIEENFSGTVTSEPVSDKNIISDSFINKTPMFTMKGVVSGVLQPGENEFKDIKSFTKDLKDVITTGTLINFISADEVYNYCILEEVTLRKTSREGKEGWSVTCRIKQLNLVDSLKITIDESPLDSIANDASKKNTLNSNTTNQINDINEFESVTTGLSNAVNALFGSIQDTQP